MRFTTYQGEATLEALTERILAKKSARSVKQAASALQEANPTLSDLPNVPAGTILRIPDEWEGAAGKQAGTAAQQTDPLDPHALLQSAQAEIRAADDATIQEAEAALKLQASEFRAVFDKNPELKAIFEQQQKQARAQRKQIEAQRAEREHLFAQAATDLEAVLKLLPQMS